MASVVVAPSINEPARKQTRWSCFGDSRHVLLRFIKQQVERRGKDSGYEHLPILTFRKQFSGICQLVCFALLDEIRMDALHGLFVHLWGLRERMSVCGGWNLFMNKQTWR